MCTTPGCVEESVSVKHYDENPLPNNGAVYPLLICDMHVERMEAGWTTVRYQDVLRMVPHAAIRVKAHYRYKFCFLCLL